MPQRVRNIYIQIHVATITSKMSNKYSSWTSCMFRVVKPVLSNLIQELVLPGLILFLFLASSYQNINFNNSFTCVFYICISSKFCIVLRFYLAIIPFTPVSFKWPTSVNPIIFKDTSSAVFLFNTRTWVSPLVLYCIKHWYR